MSIHATDPDVRTAMLRNRRGATSLRWLRALLDAGIEVHGQVVVCPGVNDGAVLDDTLCGVLERYPELASVAVVPLGVSRYNTEPDMRPHTVGEANRVVDLVEHWQGVFRQVLGRRLAFAADEYYLLAGRAFPPADTYGAFDMHEDGIGMVRAFEQGFLGAVPGTAPGEHSAVDVGIGPARGFFASVDGAPAEGYRAPRVEDSWTAVSLTPRPTAPVGVLTGAYGAMVLGPLVTRSGRDDVRVLEVENRFFGGTTGVAGLLVGEDVARVLAVQPEGHRYLLPDVCLTGGRFLDGTTPDDLPRPVEVVPTDGVSLRAALERRS